MIHFLVQYQYQYHWYILIQYTSGVSISLNHWYMTVIHLRRTTKKTAVANSSSRVSATVSRIQIPMLPGDKLWSWRRFLWLRHDTINWRSNQCCWQPDTRKCINYMSDTQTLELKMLARYSQIWKVFIKFIATLPFSAPVERLFSTARQIVVPRHNHLSDSMFEKLLLLKAKHSLF